MSTGHAADPVSLHIHLTSAAGLGPADVIELAAGAAMPATAVFRGIDGTIVAIAVGERGNAQAMAGRIAASGAAGFVTASRVHGPGEHAAGGIWRCTAICPPVAERHQQWFLGAVDRMQLGGATTAAAFLAADSLVGGIRTGAVMVTAVGAAEVMRPLVAGLRQDTPRPATVVIEQLGADGGRALEGWRALTIQAALPSGSQSAAHGALMQGLRAANVLGAVSLRGIWGYAASASEADAGWSPPHANPIVTIAVDHHSRLGAMQAVIREALGRAGRVDCARLLHHPGLAAGGAGGAP